MAATKTVAKKGKSPRETSPIAGNCKIAKTKATKAKRSPKQKAAAKALLTSEMNHIKAESMSPPALPKARKPVPTEKPKKTSPSKGPTAMERMRSMSPKSDNRKKTATKKVAEDKVTKRTKKAKEIYWPYTHIPPRQDERRKNGRQEGRNLVTWTRPRMVDKLVLHMQYELARHKIDVPWDVIAHRMHPGTSGSAVLQHFNRMRATLLAEGHLVPPALPKPGSRQPVNPLIRGYVRKFPHGSDITTMRPVPYTEPMDDLKINIPYSYDDLLDVIEAKKGKGKGKGTGKEDRVPKSRKTVSKEASPDPADLDSDADYDPSVKSPGKRQKASRSKVAKKYVKQESEEELKDSDEEVFEEDIYESQERDEEEEDEEVKEEPEEEVEEEEEYEEYEEQEVEMSDSDSSDTDNEGGAKLERESSPSDEDDSDEEEAFAAYNITPTPNVVEGSISMDSISEASVDGAVNTLYSPDHLSFPGSELIPRCPSGYVTPEMLQNTTITYNTTTLYSPITTPSTTFNPSQSREDVDRTLEEKKKKDDEPRIFSHPGAGNAFLPEFYPPQTPDLPATLAGGLLGEQDIAANETYFSEFTNLDCTSEFDDFINMPSEL